MYAATDIEAGLRRASMCAGIRVGANYGGGTSVRRMTSKVLVAALAATSLAALAEAPAAQALPPSELTMQIVAHEDDDLFFMNPDVDKAIAQNVPTVTVF